MKRFIATALFGALALMPANSSVTYPMSYSRQKNFDHIKTDRRFWAKMTAKDWDNFSPETRKEAFKNMIRYAIAENGVGKGYGKPQSVVERNIFAISEHESGWNHWALSKTGDRGVMQLAEKTIRKYIEPLDRNIKISEDSMEKVYDLFYNPWLNIRLGVSWYDTLLKENNGRIIETTKAYNTGTKNIKSERAKIYYSKVRRIMERLR